MIQSVRTTAGVIVWDQAGGLDPKAWVLRRRDGIHTITAGWSWSILTRRTRVAGDEAFFHEVILPEKLKGEWDLVHGTTAIPIGEPPRQIEGRHYTTAVHDHHWYPARPTVWADCTFNSILHEFFAAPGSVFLRCRFSSCHQRPLVCRGGSVAVIDCTFDETLSGPFVQGNTWTTTAGYLFVNNSCRSIWHGNNSGEGIGVETPVGNPAAEGIGVETPAGNPAAPAVLIHGLRYDGVTSAVTVQGPADVAIRDLWCRGWGVYLMGNAPQRVRLSRTEIREGGIACGPLAELTVRPEDQVTVIGTLPTRGALIDRVAPDTRRPVDNENPANDLSGVKIIPAGAAAYWYRPPLGQAG